MNVTITYDEAQAIIADRLGAGVSPGNITILAQGMDIPNDFSSALARAQKDFPYWATNQKIAAIKRMRELLPAMGLWEAKVTMEQPAKALAYYRKNGNYNFPQGF